MQILIKLNKQFKRLFADRRDRPIFLTILFTMCLKLERRRAAERNIGSIR